MKALQKGTNADTTKPSSRKRVRGKDDVATSAVPAYMVTRYSSGSAPALQRQPAQPQGKGKAKPPTAAQAKAVKPPLYTEYFDEMVPAILEAVDANKTVGLDRAMWLIVQSYGEQAPSSGLARDRHNRLFNEHADVVRDAEGRIAGVKPGQEREGVYIYDLNQNESTTRDSTDMKVSPTFGYDTPERATEHHLHLMQERWGGAWDALTRERSNFAQFAGALKRAGYAKHAAYDTELIALQAQVRRQVAAWLQFRVPEMRTRRTAMKEYLAFLHETRSRWVRHRGEEPDPLGEAQRQITELDGMIRYMAQEIEDFGKRLERLERFAGILGTRI